MLHSMLSASRASQRSVTRLWAALAVASIAPAPALGAALPAPPQTFDSSYVAPSGRVLPVAAGGNLQAALDKAQLGDTIVLQAGATFSLPGGPFKLPNKTSGSGWIYVVSSHLSSLPSPGVRVGPANATNMPKIVAHNGMSALITVANSHHFRFVGIEFAPAPGTTSTYVLVKIGNLDTSPTTLPHHFVFDRCYVHGFPNTNNQRGIEMDGAYVAVVDSYISHFQWVNVDAQGLWAFNTTGPLQIRNNYIEAATENVMFGGADSRQAALVPANIEIRGNHFYKSLSLIPTRYAMKNLLEFKSARRVLVTGNTFENNPLKSQNGFALLITPRNGGKAPWSVTSDIAIVDNRFINVGSGFNIAGLNDLGAPPTLMTARVLVRDNIVGVTGLNGADGRAFQFIAGGSDYTITHNTIINSATTPNSTIALADSQRGKISNLVFTNTLSTHTAYGFFGSGVGEGTRALNTFFTNWTFSGNALVARPAGYYPGGNFFPATVTSVRFVNYAGGNYALAGNSPYSKAATDGTAIGAL